MTLAWAARHRSAFMWPWETEPHSVADGILDDETYDWLAVVRGMLAQRRSARRRRRGDARRGERARPARRPGSTSTRPARAGLAGLARSCAGTAASARTRPSPSSSPASVATSRRSPTPVTTGWRTIMRSFLGRDILSLKDFSRDDFFRIFQVADDLRPYARDRRNTRPAQGQDAADRLLPAEHPHAPLDRGGHAPPGRPRARLLRREDDPRRRLLPGVAQGHLPHARVYGDVIAIRHFQQGAPAEAARWSSVPVINCGDGWGEHPTQVLTDLYTILLERGTLDGLTYLLVGDMRMRTMHSILLRAVAVRRRGDRRRPAGHVAAARVQGRARRAERRLPRGRRRSRRASARPTSSTWSRSSRPTTRSRASSAAARPG